MCWLLALYEAAWRENVSFLWSHRSHQTILQEPIFVVAPASKLGSVVECLLNTHKALDSMPSAQVKKIFLPGIY